MKEDVYQIVFWMFIIFFPPMWILIIIDYYRCKEDDKKFLEMIESKEFDKEYTRFKELKS